MTTLMDSPTEANPKEGVRYIRTFAPTEGPYDDIDLVLRDVVLSNAKTGKVGFEQRDILSPRSMEQQSLDIYAQHYLRGQIGTDDRETSVLQPIDRITAMMKHWAQNGRVIDGKLVSHGALFASETDAADWADDLKWLLSHWEAIFNSPVWYNIGVPGVAQQCSACFILGSDRDSMERIADWYRTEIRIFKGGSGSGINVSRIRSSREGIMGGGKASGPCSYMRAADASAGTMASGGRHRRAAKMVELDCDHPDLLEQADGSPGFIRLKARAEQVNRVLMDNGFDMSVDSGHDSVHVQYQNANNSVRYTNPFMEALIARGSWQLIARTDLVWAPIPAYPAEEIWRQHAVASWECGDPGIQFDDTDNWWNTTPAAGRVNGSNPCGEYRHIDDSPCNLANSNLIKFLSEDGRWQSDRFAQVCRVLAIAQTILAAYGDYPTEEVGAVARGFRQIGQGYTNLGAIFMLLGLPYDSAEARAWAAVISQQMQATIAETSAQIAAVWGAYAGVAKGDFPGNPEKELPGFDNEENRKAHLNVVEMHRDYTRAIAKPSTVSARKRSIRYGDEVHIDIYHREVVGSGEPVKKSPALREAWKWVMEAWDRSIEMGRTFGFANAYWSNIPPMGTSGLVLDQETSGLEPYFSLIVTKKKVSGDWMRLVCGLLVRALLNLGYSDQQASEIETYALEHNSVVGSPHLREDHYAVFDTASAEPKAQRFIGVDGHILMLAAVQPAISGGMSKTINLPNQVDAAAFERAHFQLWRLGVKAGALYRDGSKATQPMVSEGSDDQAGPPPTRRHKLPRSVDHKRIKLMIPQPGMASFEAYMMAGFYPNGQLGELFMLAGNEGSAINGFMAGACKQASLALQHGAPAENVIRLWMGMRFEPHAEMMPPTMSAFTRCTSPLDLAARELALLALPAERRNQLGIFTRDERSASLKEEVVETEIQVEEHFRAPTAEEILNEDNPFCFADTCGGVPMTKIQGCWVCPQCGSTTGCS